MSSLTSTLSKATEMLWKVAEIGFVANLVIILVYILLGETSGNFVISVVANIILLVDALTYQGVVTIVLAAFLYRYFTQKL
ncbi:MAG: hypothetical protein P8L41_01550 [Paracoccaceae bacterium]|jgi:hypothetical protein|nr:hypothetical protein [Marinovum sp.]MBQ65428.1 hypothetical protein [Marinovum sp.]MDG2294356.1 hypothetical protein [Paracoccaceae bacterium]|tara:strand:+ start:411 stop:653 length:243 start_codon:yes stop_codon:yes gene_type:complete